MNKENSDALGSQDLAEICITSQTSLVREDEETAQPFFPKEELFLRKGTHYIGAKLKKAEGTKCARCWKVLPEVGKDKEHKDVCLRCADAVRDYKKKDREAA